MIFGFRNGENFVYHTSDWKDHPLRATYYLVVLAIASASLHMLFNLIHSIRKKVSEVLTRKAPEASIEDGTKEEEGQMFKG